MSEKPYLKESPFKETLYNQHVIADLSFLREADTLLNTVFSNYKRDKLLQNRMLTCFYEAFSNAVLHGSAEIIDAMVYIELGALRDEKKLYMLFRDMGTGFSLSVVKDPLVSENKLRENGRGILIMRAMAASLEFSPKRNELILTFNI